jgi:hypothetical protein
MRPRGRSDPGRGSGPSKYPGTFRLAFREAAAGLGWQIRRWTGDMVECADAEGHQHVVGVDNLYRRARLEPRTDWPDLIRGFLQSVTVAEQVESLDADLAAVADRLLVRLGRAFMTMPDGTRLWSQPVAGTRLGINLVIDYPNSMSYVTEEMVNAAGRPGAEWVERAVDNLAGRTPPDCLEVIHEESGIRLCNVADAYDSSRALLLDRLLPEAGDGVFTVLPGRDELLVLPVTAEAFTHLHLLKLLALKNFKSTPYPISDEVFWIHRGAWHLFPIDVRSKEVNVQPPAEFLDILARLAPDRKRVPLEDQNADGEGPPS